MRAHANNDRRPTPKLMLRELYENSSRLVPNLSAAETFAGCFDHAPVDTFFQLLEISIVSTEIRLRSVVDIRYHVKIKWICNPPLMALCDVIQYSYAGYRQTRAASAKR